MGETGSKPRASGTLHILDLFKGWGGSEESQGVSVECGNGPRRGLGSASLEIQQLVSTNGPAVPRAAGSSAHHFIRPSNVLRPSSEKMLQEVGDSQNATHNSNRHPAHSYPAIRTGSW